jgi:DNA-binding beta-propeller fold protein YncE
MTLIATLTGTLTVISKRWGVLLTAFLVFSIGGSWVCADYPLPPARTGNAYISSYGTDEVICYDGSYNFLFRFGHADLDGTRGLSFTDDGELYVASQGTDRILVFNENGDYQRQFTGPGLDAPTGMAVASDGRLYVSAFNSDDVHVFRDEVQVDTFSAVGMNGPNCVAFAPNGDVFVISQLDSRVYQFASDFTFLRKFTGGGLSSAMGAAVYQGELFVTGGSSHSVNVFDLDGNYLRVIRDELIDGPQGIAFDDQGRFSVSSFYTGKVALYQTDGQRVEVFEEAGISIARSVAYFPVRGRGEFIRGDFNRDNAVDVVDPMAVLNHMFATALIDPCLDAADFNDDGLLDTTDPIASLAYQFLAAPPPPAPYPEAGLDETGDDLTCDGV